MRAWPAVLLLVATLLVPTGLSDDPDPPTLGAVGVAPGIYRPGDEVRVTIHVEDASGVAQVWGMGKGPGDLPLPSLQCPDGGGQRVVDVECRLRLHERTPAGQYRVTMVWAQDVVGHTSEAVVDAAFTVESPYSDVEGPRLVRLEQKVTELDMDQGAAGNGWVSVADAFDIEATDASALNSAGLQFTGPNGNSGMWGQCDGWVDGRATCTLYADADVPAGEYRLREVQVRDEIGYHTMYIRDPWIGGNVRALGDIVPAPVTVQVRSERDDAQAPVMTDLTFPGRLHRGQPFELRLNATDASLVESAQVYFRTTRGNAGYSVWHVADCVGAPAPERQLVCTGRFPANFPLGLALVDWAVVEDDARNLRWLRPAEVGGSCCGDTFTDGDRFDVGTVLVPRPIEGVLEAVDVVVNELLPGEVATIVYEAQDTVDDVTLVLEDATDGSVLEVACHDAVRTLLGNECQVQVPQDEEGVLSLVQATASTATGTQTTTYAAGEVPLLAVRQAIPAPDAMALARGGGPSNQVGLEWATVFQAAKQEAQQALASGVTGETAITQQPPEAGTGPGLAHLPPSSVLDPRDGSVRVIDLAGDPTAGPRRDVEPTRGADAEPIPALAAMPLAALALALAWTRRRGA